MKIIGNIPQGAQEKINAVIKDKQSIKIVWADDREVHVVGVQFNHSYMKDRVYGYRFFQLGDNWEWSGDLDEWLSD